MIVRICGQLIEKKDSTVVVDVQGICYGILVPLPVMQRVEQVTDEYGRIVFIIYHYVQISPSSGFPVLIGFLNDVEREFFQQFIKVSGIGPRAAVKALNKPFSQISQAIDDGNCDFLKTLPGIGIRKAKEIVAKLQGKVGKYGLIQDQAQTPSSQPSAASLPEWKEEALGVLLQLQYKKAEALAMIDHALQRAPQITNTEQLLNEIYKQRIKV